MLRRFIGPIVDLDLAPRFIQVQKAPSPRFSVAGAAGIEDDGEPIFSQVGKAEPVGVAVEKKFHIREPSHLLSQRGSSDKSFSGAVVVEKGEMVDDHDMVVGRNQRKGLFQIFFELRREIAARRDKRGSDSRIEQDDPPFILQRSGCQPMLFKLNLLSRFFSELKWALKN